MASRRMISTRFFKDPDIINLSSKDTQLILIGLVLAADDEGREVAHAKILGREMDYSAEQMEVALQELAANDLLMLYQVGKHRYYQLSRAIRGWQTLGGRMTPSRYPAPPITDASEREGSAQHVVEKPGKTRGNSQHFPEQCNITEHNKTEDGETQTCKVVPFPCIPTTPSDVDNEQRKGVSHSSAELYVLTQQIAHILRLPVTEALTRLVAEYAQITSLSLPGEADAAREWIDDQERNKKRRRMSPAFFRNWLKREQDAAQRRQSMLQQSVQATGTHGPASSSPVTFPVGRRPPNLMYLADEDRQVKQTQGGKS